MLSCRTAQPLKGVNVDSTGPYPQFVDWTMKGNFVTPVKNQVSLYSAEQPTYSYIIV